jgi:PhnB protein
VPKLNPYLNFPGNAEEAFNFYRSVFRGEFSSLARFRDMPMEGANVPEAVEDKIMYVALPIGSDVLMGSDAWPSMGLNVTFGNHAYISVHADSKEEAGRLFRALSEGGSVEMPIADQAWGDYFGSLTDRFGVKWMVSYTYPR